MNYVRRHNGARDERWCVETDRSLSGTSHTKVAESGREMGKFQTIVKHRDLLAFLGFVESCRPCGVGKLAS